LDKSTLMVKPDWRTKGNLFADGGIATTPSIAGEDGAEAVIPLKNGVVPLKVDFGQLVAVLEANMGLTREMISEMRDSKDIQQRLLNNSY